MLRYGVAVVVLQFTLATGLEAQKLRPRPGDEPGLSTTEGLPQADDYGGRKARREKRKAKVSAEDNYFTSRGHKAQKRRQQVIEEDKEKKPHPDYFGHRGKLHRRPAGRLRYCRICGIRH